MMERDVNFWISLMERAEVETTSWSDCGRTVKPGDMHIAIRRSLDNRERHLHGDDAKEFLRLLGAPDCWRSA